MAYCYPDNCGEYAVSPVLVAPSYSSKCCEDAPMCQPCLPRCPKGGAYCCDKKAHHNSVHHHDDCCDRHHDHDYCYDRHHDHGCDRHHDHGCDRYHDHGCDRYHGNGYGRYHDHGSNRCHDHGYDRYHDHGCDRYHDYHHHRRHCHTPPPSRKSSDHFCRPVKTKYVIPCYRYEDGRIEQYVPTRHGRLPMSAYRRNGMQDQIHGYRGAMRYLCAGESPQGCCVFTAVEPLRVMYPKVRQLPVSAFKRNGMQDQEHSKTLGTTNFLKRCPHDVCIECDVCTQPVKNQPTLLMNRACEVAVGTRRRRKPFVSSSYHADGHNEVHRFHSEDERGNFCFHFEKKRSCGLPLHGISYGPRPSQLPCLPCVSSPECQFTNCVHAKAIGPHNTCCFYCK